MAKVKVNAMRRDQKKAVRKGQKTWQQRAAMCALIDRIEAQEKLDRNRRKGK